jgi:hypothetical protein
MVLPRAEAELVLDLHAKLMDFANSRLKVQTAEKVLDFTTLPPQARREVVEAFLTRRDLIDAFVTENPANLPREKLEIVSAWRHLVAGQFIVLRPLKNHTVLLSCDDNRVAYGVLGLSCPLADMIPAPLPAMIETVLLPFRGRITYDGLAGNFNVRFGSGARRNFEDQFRQAKAHHQFFLSLPGTSPATAVVPASASAPAPRRKDKPHSIPAKSASEVADSLQELEAKMDAFCRTHLNDEYAALCRALAEKLARKRPSPLVKGPLDSWAAGIIRTIGWVNFLADRSQSPHLKMSVIDQAFGILESTGQAKSKAIRHLAQDSSI